MLLSPIAVEKLRQVTAFTTWPYTTHEQRNELARMFLQEAGRLLNQEAESTIKHLVEVYSNGDISYERYMELIGQLSQEEAARGATQGAEYARNRVFDFAQKALDRAKEQAHALALADARKQFEGEKQKTQQGIKDLTDQYEHTLQSLVKLQETDLEAFAQQQKTGLVQDQERITEQTRAQIEQVLLNRIQEERERQEEQIREQEALRPAREAAREAIGRVTLRERQVRDYKLRRNGLLVLGLLVVLALILLLLFVSLPQWGFALLVLAAAAIFIIAFFWRSPIAEARLAEDRRQIALYQTKSGEYAATSSEEDRCALLVQKIA